MMCNQVNLLFLHLCLKSEPEEQRSHKVVTVMSIEIDLLLLVSLLFRMKDIKLYKSEREEQELQNSFSHWKSKRLSRSLAFKDCLKIAFKNSCLKMAHIFVSSDESKFQAVGNELKGNGLKILFLLLLILYKDVLFNKRINGASILKYRFIGIYGYYVLNFLSYML